MATIIMSHSSTAAKINSILELIFSSNADTLRRPSGGMAVHKLQLGGATIRTHRALLKSDRGDAARAPRRSNQIL
jgi:hypothetical protein